MLTDWSRMKVTVRFSMFILTILVMLESGPITGLTVGLLFYLFELLREYFDKMFKEFFRMSLIIKAENDFTNGENWD